MVDDVNSAVWDEFGSGSVPNNVIIDQDGVVQYNALGWNQTVIESLLEDLLEPSNLDGSPELPGSIRLTGAFPNPFNGATRIEFDLLEPQDIHLQAWTLAGRPVRELYSGYQPGGTGSYGWDGLDEAGQALPSALYLVTLKTARHTESLKLLLNK